jgi:transcription-repair coupling factor (superfamily II helicase)
MSLKIKLRQMLITKLEQGKDKLVFAFHEKTPVEPQRILALVENAKDDYRFTPDGKLMVTLPSQVSHSPQAILHTAGELLETLRADLT